jgi:hypothetical protein
MSQVAREVVNKEQKSVNMTNFFKEMINPDEDYAILALNALQEVLEQHHQLNVPKGGEAMFINKFTDAVISKNSFVVTAALKVLSLLIKYFKVESIPMILNNLLAVALSDQSADIKPQILTIIKDNISLATSFTEERNAAIFEVLFTNQKNNLTTQKGDNLVFILELISTIYQYLGYRASNEDNKFVIEKIIWLLENNLDNSIIMSGIVYLLQSWCQFATEELVSQIIEYVKKDKVNETVIPFNLIYALTIKATKLLKPYLDDILQLFVNVVNETTEFLQENEPTDEVVVKCSNAIVAISKIVDYFTEFCAQKQDEIFSVAFSFISYDCDTILMAAKQEEEEDEGDDDFGDDDLIDEDMEIIDDGEGASAGRSTWELRKSSVALCNSLLNQYPEEFLSYFLGQYEDFNTIIQDSDIGVQIDAYMIISKIFNKFTSEIPEEIVDLVVSTICNTTNAEQKSITTALSTLMNIIKVTGTIKEEYALTIIENLAANITTTAANQLFRLSQEIIKINTTEAIIDAVCNLLISTSSLPASYIATAIEVAVNVYAAAKKATESIIQLNRFVIESTSSGLECVASALPTVAIFLVSFNGAETSNESIELIKTSLTKPMVRKALLGALTIISSSKDACKLIQPFIEQIGESLITSFKGNDASVQFRGLWATKLFLEQGILSGDMLEKILVVALDLISTGDNRTRTLALEVINESKNSNIVQQAQLKLKEALSSQVEKNFITSAVNFVKANISEKLVNELIEVGEQEIKQGERGEKAALTTADIIGLAIAGTELEDHVELGNSVFTTLVAGALGTVSDISKNQELVDKIFDLATNYDNRTAFAAASEAVGRVSVGSPSTLNRLIILSDKDDQHIPTWITAYNALAIASVGKLTAKQLAPVVKYLLECRGGAQNTKTCAEALSYIAQADNAFIAEYFKEATPISIYALSLLAARSGEELVASLIKSAIAIVDTKNPIVSGHAASILISALKFPSLLAEVAEGAQKFISCIKFIPEHIIIEDMGLSKTETDIGKALRINAITITTILANTIPIAEVIDETILALKDPSPEVVAKALVLLSKLTSIDLESVNAKEEEAVAQLIEIEKTLKQPEVQLVLEAPFNTALGSLTANGLNSAKFLELASRHNMEANYQKGLNERTSTEASATESRYSSLVNFLAQYNKDASTIFNE